jgi:hypothetical protein
MSDWSVHLLQLAARGQLGRVGRKLLLDLPALSQSFACVTSACTPGIRAKDARSCCADLEVTVSEAEQAAITAALPEIAAHLGWSDIPAVFDGDTLTRPKRRCVFAVESPLRCGLHTFEDTNGLKRGTLKPLPCRLFPLVIVDAEDGRTLVTAIHTRTATLAGSRPARVFPCLGAEAPTIAESCADTLLALYGEKAAVDIARQARAWSAAGQA